MIDVHCHLNFQSFNDDYDNLIKEALKAGVGTIINVGTQVSSSSRAVEIAEKYANLYAIIGVHPHHADKINDDWLKKLELLAISSKVIGVGECGLDYFNYKSNGIVDPLIQEKVFASQIELAGKLKLPLQIHSRDEKARVDSIGLLKKYRKYLQDPPGMFHCMAGSIESLKSILDMGFYVGYDGNITYNGIPPGEPLLLKELVSYSPMHRIIIETDSPYLPPVPFRGQRNEPKHAIIIARYIAKLKNLPFEEVMEQTDNNARAIFKKLKVHIKLDKRFDL